jgi:hypothetical protein
VTTGFSNALKVSCRSCFSRAKCKVGDALNCENGAADKSNNDKPWLDGETSRELIAAVIEAKSEQVCQHSTTGPTIGVADKVFESFKKDRALAIESQSEVEPTWLVRVVRKRGCMGPAARFEQWGVGHCLGKAERALEVIRLFPSSSRSTNAHCEDAQKVHFFSQPCCCATRIWRLGWVIEKRNNSGGGNRSRAAVGAIIGSAGAGEGEQPEVYYELSVEKRREVALLCRECA